MASDDSSDNKLSIDPTIGQHPFTAEPQERDPSVGTTAKELRLPGRFWGRFRESELGKGVRLLGSLGAYAAFIVTFGFQVARVDGVSMAPTLEDRDRLFIDKVVYEYRDPSPGDIVMLYYPRDPNKLFVKRVMATEGDTVEIVDGHVSVNGHPVSDDYVAPEYRDHDQFGPRVIPEGYDFVMGDHRNNSSDSRDWGMVPKRYIVGRVTARWWPLSDARLF